MTKFLYYLFFVSSLALLCGSVKAQQLPCYEHNYDIHIKIDIIKKPSCAGAGQVALSLEGADLNQFTPGPAGNNDIQRVFQGKKPDGTRKQIALNALQYGEFEVEYIKKDYLDGIQRKLCSKGFMSYDMMVGEISGVRCPNAPKASFVVKGTGGSGSYKYEVEGLKNNTGIFNSNIPVTADGKYKVRIQDAACPNLVSMDTIVTINDYSGNQIKITGDSTLCPGATLNLTASMTNLPAGSTFAWTKVGSAVSISSIANLQIANLTTVNNGQYQVAINIPGCSQVATKLITVKVATPAAPTVTNKAICLGTSAIDFTTLVVPTSSNYTIRWYKELTGGSFEAIPPTSNYSTADPNIFTWYVTQYESTLNCETPVRTPVSVEVQAIPASIASTNIKIYGVSLANMQIIITAKAGFTYQLHYKTGVDPGDVPLSEVKNTGSTDKDFLLSYGTDLSEGDYYVRTISNINCPAKDPTRIIVKPAPLITGIVDICEGSNIKLTAEAITGASYKWTDPKGVTLTATNNILDNITSIQEQHSGLFKVAITTPFGVLNDEFNVVVKRIAPPTGTTSYAYCKDATNATKLSATALAGNTLVWYAPGSTVGVVDAPTPLTGTAGTVIYGVSQKDASGCESKQLKITVVVKPPADVSQLIVQACIDAKPEIVIKGSEASKRYRVVNDVNDSVSTWIPGTGTATSIRVKTDREVTTETTYRVIVRSAATCDASVSVPIIPLNAMILPTSTSNVCLDGTIKLEAYVFSGATYTWKLPDGSTKSGNPLVIPSVKNANTGNYQLTISQPSTANSDVCNIVALPFKVTVGKPLAPTVDKISYRYCVGDVATTLTALASSGNTLQWYDKDGVKLSAAPTSSIISTAVPGTVTYTVTQFVTSSPDCESPGITIAINTFEINELADFEEQQICENSKPRIVVNNSLNDVDYTLYSQSGTVLDKKAGNGGLLYLDSPEPIASTTTYNVGMNSTAVCVSNVKKSVQFAVTTLYIKPDKARGYKRGIRYELELETNAMSKPYNFSYTGDLPFGFTFSSLGIIEGTAPTTGSSEAKTFTVHIESPSGCSVEKTYTLETDLLIPQAFSPNGDGVNDYFLLSFHVIIFDRQGVIIHEGHNGWDGTNKGKVVPSGTYFYKVNYINDKGEAKTAYGYVMVL